jgi:hypothetical protein
MDAANPAVERSAESDPLWSETGGELEGNTGLAITSNQTTIHVGWPGVPSPQEHRAFFVAAGIEDAARLNSETSGLVAEMV